MVSTSIKHNSPIPHTMIFVSPLLHCNKTYEKPSRRHDRDEQNGFNKNMICFRSHSWHGRLTPPLFEQKTVALPAIEGMIPEVPSAVGVMAASGARWIAITMVSGHSHK